MFLDSLQVRREEEMTGDGAMYFSSKVDEEGSDGTKEDEVLRLLSNGEEVKSPETVIGQLTNDYHERAKALQLCDGSDGFGRLEEAVVDFNRVIERNHKNAHAYFRRAFCHKSMGSYDRGALCYFFCLSF